MIDEKQKLNIFIDSNIFLNFYDFHHEDLEKLAQLVELVSGDGVDLFVTKQVKEEIHRHRETKLAKAYKKFKDSKASLEMPVVCQAYAEYSSIKDVQKKLNSIKSELSKKLWSDIVSKNLEADKIIKSLFEVGTELDSHIVIEKAKTRYLLGNPPGKQDRSHGDEINWEALLEYIPTDNHFVLISDDKDFKSPLNENELREFLISEWEQNKKSKILFYRSLTSFFKEHEINIELRWEEEKDRLIQELSESPNFSTTHEVMKMLSKFIGFSEEQIKKIGRSAILNSQVAWISQDADVKNFYDKHVLSRKNVFSQEEQVLLEKIFETPDVEFDPDDFPF